MKNNFNFIKEEIDRSWKNIDYDISISKVMLLIEMASNDIYSDGSFGDNDCCIWSAIRRVINSKE